MTPPRRRGNEAVTSRDLARATRDAARVDAMQGAGRVIPTESSDGAARRHVGEPPGGGEWDLGWAQGAAMSALAALEELDELGECYWCPGVPFTMAMRLCNDDGWVEVERDGEIRGYECTGGAHRFGEHIRCTSPAHTLPRDA